LCVEEGFNIQEGVSATSSPLLPRVLARSGTRRLRLERKKATARFGDVLD
jgi:hypothetical protein